MNPKLKTMLVKGALGIVVSTVIGYMIKMEVKAEARIEEHFSPKEEQEN